MIIRTYTAESVAAALKQVRSEMGGQAVVLKTRMVETPHGQKAFEVTACLDKPSVEQAGKTLVAEAPGPAAQPKAKPVAVAKAAVPPPASRVDLSEHTPKQGQTSPQPVGAAVDARFAALEAKLDKLMQLGVAQAPQDPRVQKIVAQLRKSDLPESDALALVDDIKASGAEFNDEAVRRALSEKLSSLIADDFNLQTGDRVLVLGPAGAGKTSVLGKLAAQLITEKKTAVRLTSLDNSKIGGIDELESYGALLGMTVDHDAVDMPIKPDHVLLIDSGVMPSTEKDVATLKARINKLAPSHCLAVVSALTRALDMERLVARAVSLGAASLVVTMTDLANGWGAVMTTAQNSGLKLTLVSDAPGGAGRLRAPETAAIVDAMLSSEAGCE